MGYEVGYDSKGRMIECSLVPDSYGDVYLPGCFNTLSHPKHITGHIPYHQPAPSYSFRYEKAGTVDVYSFDGIRKVPACISYQQNWQSRFVMEVMILGNDIELKPSTFPPVVAFSNYRVINCCHTAIYKKAKA